MDTNRTTRWLSILLVTALVTAPAIPLLSRLAQDTSSLPSPVSEELTEATAVRKSVAAPCSIVLIFHAEAPLHGPLVVCGACSVSSFRLDPALFQEGHSGRSPPA